MTRLECKIQKYKEAERAAARHFRFDCALLGYSEAAQRYMPLVGAVQVRRWLLEEAQIVKGFKNRTGVSAGS